MPEEICATEVEIAYQCEGPGRRSGGGRSEGAVSLDRPSRFDRKYYFHLPAEAERVAYIAAWHKELKPELRLSETARVELVRQTEGFSFAYLKELFLSSMMQWMAGAGGSSVAGAGGSSMDEVMLSQAAQLRAQMTNPEVPAAAAKKEE